MKRKVTKKRSLKKHLFTRGKDYGCKCDKEYSHFNCTSAIYGFGFIGSLIYFISTANSFWEGVLGVLKSFVWPAFLVYKLFGL